MSADWMRVIRVGDLKEGQIRLARMGVRQVAVTRVQGRAYAFRNGCPHAGQPLHQGRLSGPWIECSRHRWRFDVRDGSCPEHPEYALRCYPSEERDDGWLWARATEDDEIW
jgi:nitrite reductase/ring-hydroxylating ferredoxin subunit